MPRYQFVTNFTRVWLVVHSGTFAGRARVRFYPQSRNRLRDISAARAASDVAALIEQNINIEQLLTLHPDIFCGRMASWARYVRYGSGWAAVWFSRREILEALGNSAGRMFMFAPDAGKRLRRIRRTASIRKRVWNRQHQALVTERQGPLLTACSKRLQPSSVTAQERADVTRQSTVCAGCSRAATERKICGGRNGFRCRGGPGHGACRDGQESDFYRRRPGAEHADLGERDAWSIRPAMEGGSASAAKLKRAYPHAAEKIETSRHKRGGRVRARSR